MTDRPRTDMNGISTVVEESSGGHFRSLVHRLQPRGFRDQVPVAVRDRVISPHLDEDSPLIHDHKERDPQADAATSPEADERIDLYCTWGIEFYTPSHYEGLIESLSKLGMRSDARDPSDRARAWLSRLSRFHGQFTWMNLGHLIPEGSNLEFGRDTYFAKLPQDVKYASFGIYAISPSLTSLVVCFVFDEGMSMRFDNALRETRRRTNESLRGGNVDYDPRTAKTEAIKVIRTSIRSTIELWFSHNLPGLFSPKLIDNWFSRNLPSLFTPVIVDNWFSDNLRGLLSPEVVHSVPHIPNIPTCELITLQKAEPFPSYEEKGTRLHDYLDILGLKADYDVWQSSGMLGLKFRMPEESSTLYHSVLAVNERQHIRPDRDARIEQINKFTPHLLSLWTILAMNERYTQHLNRVRDSVRVTSNIQVLEALKSEIAYNVDISAVTSELSSYSKESRPLIPDLDQFELRDGESGKDLRKNLESIVGDQIASLQKRNKSLRNHLMRYGTLVGAVNDVRNQKRTSRLTWVSLIMAGVMLLATAHSFWSTLSTQ